jgi:hypothetical protein
VFEILRDEGWLDHLHPGRRGSRSASVMPAPDASSSPGP